MTRSPITIALSILLLGIDSVINTLIYSEVQIGNRFHWECDLAIVATIVGQYGFMIATGLRIFRISNVYRKYRRYVES